MGLLDYLKKEKFSKNTISKKAKEDIASSNLMSKLRERGKEIEEDYAETEIIDEVEYKKNQLMKKKSSEGDHTKKLIAEQLTQEKQVVADLLEEKIWEDVTDRPAIVKKKRKTILEDKAPSIFDRIKSIFEGEDIEQYNPNIHGPLVSFTGKMGYEELERYWVDEPYSFVVVLYNPNLNDYIYYVAEPELTPFEKTFLKELKDRLQDVLLVEDVESDEDKEKVLVKKVKKLVKDYAIKITPSMFEKILYYIIRDFVKFGKINALMEDDTIEDISCNGHNIPIFLYHKKYRNIQTNIIFEEEELNSFIIRLAQKSGKHISVAEPLVDAAMPDGSRIQMTLGTAVTSHGSTFTIRRFSETPITPVNLIKWGTFSAESLAYLWLCIENNKSLIFAGGTASGKTSSLNAVSLFIPPKAKIVTLEDTHELNLPHPNWIPGITRDSSSLDGRGAIDMYDLLKAALRQRPEYLLVGEVRGREALTLFQAMSTGHTTFSTMHADSVESAIHRLENPPISVPRTMIQALDIVSIQAQTYTKGKRVRRNLYLVEILDIDPRTKNIRTDNIFTWDSETDTFIKTGSSKALEEIRKHRAWTPEQLNQELKYRQKVLEYLVDHNIEKYEVIAEVIQAYSSIPLKVLKKLKIIDSEKDYAFYESDALISPDNADAAAVSGEAK